MGWLRLLRSLISFWLGYLRWIRPAVNGGALVVGDRWAYGYAGQPHALGFAGPAWLGRLFCLSVPRPDLLVRLSAPPELVAERKSDLDVAEVINEDRLWSQLPLPALRLDASMDVQGLAACVLGKLEERSKRL